MSRSKAEAFADWMVSGVAGGSAVLEPMREKALEAEEAAVHGLRQGIHYLGSRLDTASPMVDQIEAYAAEATPYAVRWGALGVIGLSVFRAGRDVYRSLKSDPQSEDSFEAMSNRPGEVDSCGGAYGGSVKPPFKEAD